MADGASDYAHKQKPPCAFWHSRFLPVEDIITHTCIHNDLECSEQSFSGKFHGLLARSEGNDFDQYFEDQKGPGLKPATCKKMKLSWYTLGRLNTSNIFGLQQVKRKDCRKDGHILH